MLDIGQPLKRFEDRGLVTGHGAFVDDMQLPAMLYAAVLRSSHAHARIRVIDGSVARSAPGVVAGLTGEAIAGLLREVPTRAMAGGWDVAELNAVEQPVLARGRVC
jgi:carbon-monoxide dehydrogenase large subunit